MKESTFRGFYHDNRKVGTQNEFLTKFIQLSINRGRGTSRLDYDLDIVTFTETLLKHIHICMCVGNCCLNYIQFTNFFSCLIEGNKTKGC